MKWCGLTLCVLFAAMMLLSRNCSFSLTPGTIQTPVRGPTFTQECDWIAIVTGQIVYCYIGEPAKDSLGDPWLGVRYESFPPERGEWGLLRLPSWINWGFGITTVHIPLWLPFLLIALPTGFLLYSDRKQNRPGLCAVCRYDLRGLPETTAKCPECGREIKSQETARG